MGRGMMAFYGCTLQEELPKTDRVEELKEALRKAILNTHRTVSKCIDYDPAGSTYEVDWSPEVKEWAKLADLDLDKHDPCHI